MLGVVSKGEVSKGEVSKGELICCAYSGSQWVASSPGPPVVFSVKSFVHLLAHMRKIILTKNTELSLRYTLGTI